MGTNAERSLLDYFTSISMASKRKNLDFYYQIQHLGRSAPLTIVEVGVGNGGSLAIAALALRESQSLQQQLASTIIGFDLFGPQESYGPIDKDGLSSKIKIWREFQLHKKKNYVPEAYSLNNVQTLILSSKFSGKLKLIPGDVCETIPNMFFNQQLPRHIDILRISCNWYKPVATALKYLMPLDPSLVYLDGCYHWGGFQKAVLESDFKFILSFGYKIEDLHIFVKN